MSMTSPTTDTLEILTDAQLDEIFAREVAGFTPMWYVRKCGLYYRPNAAGYTSVESEAGLFTEAQAEKHEYPYDEPVTILRAPWKRYSTDANEVQPYLNGASVMIEHVCYEDWEVITTPSDSEDDDWDYSARAVAPTLARAACVSLIRATRLLKARL